VFAYWEGEAREHDAPGAAGVTLCERILCSPVSVRPLLASELAAEEVKRVELTRQQSRLLRALGMRRRAVICGGAGTGKTLLALERAREMARAGKRVLLLCYNRALSDFLKAAAEGVDGLHAMTFHQLCDWRIRVARTETGKDLAAEAARDFPGRDRFDVQLPYALARSTEETTLRYDAVIVDEAQDFLADYWLPIEMLLADPAQGLLYAFLDHNQAIYGRAARPPIDDDPFLLTANCRNTRFIHEAAYRHYTGIETDHPEIDGAPFEELLASTPDAQAGKVAAAVTKLLGEEKVSAADVAVLVVRDAKQPLYDAIARQPLPRGTRWGVELHRVPGAITVDTVARFKGLEAAIVFLCGFESASPSSEKEMLYVGLSRAKSRIILVGSTEAVRRNFA
jgi:superfamily I DNA/RNA helicase